jgi:hypothetical protein
VTGIFRYRRRHHPVPALLAMLALVLNGHQAVREKIEFVATARGLGVPQIDVWIEQPDRGRIEPQRAQPAPPLDWRGSLTHWHTQVSG